MGCSKKTSQPRSFYSFLYHYIPSVLLQMFIINLGGITLYKEKWYHSSWFIGLLFTGWFLILPLVPAIILIIQRNKELKKVQRYWEDNEFDKIANIKDELKRLTDEIQLLTSTKEKITSELEEFKPLTDLNITKIQIRETISNLEKEKENLVNKLDDITSLVDISESKQRITNEIDDLSTKKQEIVNEIMKLQENIIELKEELLMQSFGFFESKYNFESSEAYQVKMNEIRKEQKQLVKDKRATDHSLDWTIGSDTKKGREFILDTIKLTIRAFNNECDNVILKVKFNNLEASEKRINKVYEDLNKLTDMQNVSITKQYLNLKIAELYLKYEYEQKKQEEKEEQLAIKEQMREEAKALKELEKAKEKVEKEEKHFEQAIETLKQQLTETNENKQAKLLAKLKELEAQLEETKKNKEDVLFRVQHTRAGYVYIISNIGSFGENVFKIGMTRRLEPMDRVKELGDASVPFTFDVHGMIFSEDAPSLENALHKAFADKKVNKVNERKEFFNVELDEIEDVVKKNHNKTVAFTKLAEAEDFRKSLQLQKELQSLS